MPILCILTQERCVIHFPDFPETLSQRDSTSVTCGCMLPAMLGSYWRRVFSKAAADTAHVLDLDSWERVLIKGVILGGAIWALWMWGSPDASRDETIVRAAVVLVSLGLFYPLIFLWKLIFAPAALEAEKETAHSSDLQETRTQLEGLAVQLDAMPDPRLVVRQHRGNWVLQIHNANADAEFTVKIDLSETRVPRAPDAPVYVRWVDRSDSQSKEIPSSGWDQVILLGVEHRDFSSTCIFHWVGDSYLPKHTTSWIPGNENTIKPTGTFLVFVSSKPPTRGGSRKLEFSFEGSELSLVSGEAEMWL